MLDSLIKYLKVESLTHEALFVARFLVCPEDYSSFISGEQPWRNCPGETISRTIYFYGPLYHAAKINILSSKYQRVPMCSKRKSKRKITFPRTSCSAIKYFIGRVVKRCILRSMARNPYFRNLTLDIQLKLRPLSGGHPAELFHHLLKEGFLFRHGLPRRGR